MILAPTTLRRHRERGGESPLLLPLPWPPPRWEESSRSIPWPPWQRRGRSPSEIGSFSLFSFVSCSPDLAKNRFLYSRRSVTPIALIFLHDFFSGYKLPCAQSRAPTDVRGEHNPPPRAWPLGRSLVSCGGCGRPFPLIPSPKNHIYSKIILREFLSHLDFI